MTLYRHKHDPHYISITIRPSSPTRKAINISVKQIRDAAGGWMLPTITISEAIPQTSEDVVFMRTVAEGLLIACLEFIDMLDYIE